MVKFFSNIFQRSLSEVNKDESSFVKIGQSSVIKNSRIILRNKSKLICAPNVKIDGVNIQLNGGELIIGESSILTQTNDVKLNIYVNDGRISIKDHSIIRSVISVRFGGEVNIGSYTAINQGTIIRCDDSIAIGDFVMISYECLIFDTNTHNLLPFEVRRERTKADFPFIGREDHKPDTDPIFIGDDCWVGQRAVILKGVNMERGAIAGTASVVSGQVPFNCVAVGNPCKIIENKKSKISRDSSLNKG